MSGNSRQGRRRMNTARYFFTGEHNGCRFRGSGVEKQLHPAKRVPYYVTEPIKTPMTNDEQCDRYRLRWLNVIYESGQLQAVAYRDGKKIGEATMKPPADRHGSDSPPASIIYSGTINHKKFKIQPDYSLMRSKTNSDYMITGIPNKTAISRYTFPFSAGIFF